MTPMRGRPEEIYLEAHKPEEKVGVWKASQGGLVSDTLKE